MIIASRQKLSTFDSIILSMKLKNKTSLSSKLLIIGIIFIFLSAFMFIIGVGMFTSRNDYNQLIIKISQFCFIFWAPFLVIGIVFSFISLILIVIKSDKLKAHH